MNKKQPVHLETQEWKMGVKDGETIWLSAFERYQVPRLVELSLGFISGKRNGGIICRLFLRPTITITDHDAELVSLLYAALVRLINVASTGLGKALKAHCCAMNCTLNVLSGAGSVGNAYVGLTEEDSQHLSKILKVATPLQINAVTYTVAIITADLESLCLSITKSSEVQAICSRFGVIQEVGFSFKWSFERSTALKTLIVRKNVEGALRTKNTDTLTHFVKRDGSSDIMRF
ncbi:hypothetical protein T07_4952 [Trichinella nelsoni]|uniref:Uncharacterized protein n=1 Tax=Trichinella nelsoni TaxID=6336 RepID=A0A0V0RR89_9BILA|nr:hypothetical protein T07_4952 [Trichinella nelsoni]